MSQTTGIINGSDLKIMVVAEGGTELVVDNVTDCSISVTNDFRDSTVKANAGYKAMLPGMTSANLNFSALYATDAGAGKGFEAMSGFQLNKTKLDISFTHVIGQGSTENAGDFKYQVKGYIESLELSGGTEDNAQFSCGVMIVETIVREVIS
tara:strand:- start:129 stop:584 length:456 start_codon:yes stop_codon:yes gene_type:complete